MKISWMRAAALAIIACGAVWLAAEDRIGFSSIQRLTNGEVQLRLAVTSSYRIDVSTNLNSWSPLLTSARQSTQHLDSAAAYFTNRFYSAHEVPGTNVLTGDHFATADGEVIVRPVNHASFVMRWNERMIYNDPVGANSLYTNFPKAHLILVSHNHSDHFSAATLAFARNTNGIIIAPQSVYNGLSATLRAATVVLTNSASTNLFGIHIEAVPAYNANHPIRSGNGYVVTMGGQRFYMAGDTGDIPEMRALQNIDVAFLPMNIPFTMNIASAASATRDFRPKVLYPYHYRNQDGTFANLTELKRLIGREHGIEVRTRAWY